MDTDPKKIVVKKPGGKSPVVINPPEKTLTGGHNEAFETSLQKHTSICETRTKIILQAKAAKFDIPEQVALKVFVRGLKAFPSSSSLTREQYAMDHVNSFINGGAAMEKEWDLIPIQIDERLHTRMGTKGTGGAGRAHIKREKSPYNGKMIYHVVDRRGVIKHSTQDEMQAKRHLASKYRSYMESTSNRSFIVIDEARASAALKLSQAYDQRKQSSEASRTRAAAAKAEFEKQWQEKQSKPKPVVAENVAGDVKRQQGMAEVAGAQKCWPGHRKVGTQAGTGKNAGKRVNDCEKIGEYYQIDKLSSQPKLKLKPPKQTPGDGQSGPDVPPPLSDKEKKRVKDLNSTDQYESVKFAATKNTNSKLKLINMLHLKMQRKLKITDND